jgi:hypothetical protein
MVDNPGDAQGKPSAVDGAPAAPAAAPPREPAGTNGQPSTIKVGDKEFRAEDVQGILAAKAGLEAEKGELKKKLDAYESEKLSEKERLEKEKKTLAEENAALKRSVLNGKVSQALAKAGVAIKAELLNLQITDESQIETAVQNLIRENPALVIRAAGGQPAPPGAPSPASPPPGGDIEKELEQGFANCSTLKEYKELETRLYAMRGQKPPEGRKPI